MFNKAIIPALLVSGLGISVAGCEELYKDRNLFADSQPKKEAVKPITEVEVPEGYNKPQTRDQELDEYCANKTGGFITTYVEAGGQRLTCEEYVTLRAQGWSATETATDRPGKTFTVEKIIRLNNAGLSDEVILQFLKSARSNDTARRNRGIIAENMTPAQIAEAEILARERYAKKQKRAPQVAAAAPGALFDGYWSGKLNCYNHQWWTLMRVVVRGGKLVIKNEPTQQQAPLDISGEFDSEGRIKLKGWADNSAGISQHIWIKAKVKGDRIEGWGMLDADDCVFSVGRD